MKKLFSLLLIAAAACLSSAASQVSFTHTDAADSHSAFGFLGATHYEAAMRLDDALLPGKQITRVQWRIHNPSTVSSMELFIAYRLDKSLRAVYHQEVDVPADGLVDVELDTPFELTTSTIYVGYRLDCTTDMTSPLGVVDHKGDDYGFIWRYLSNADWDNDSQQRALDMTVWIDGDFAAEAVRLASIAQVNVAKGVESTITVPVCNAGASPVASVGYAWILGETSGSGTHTFSQPIPASLGYSALLPITFTAQQATGQFADSQIRITAVNGKPFETALAVDYNVVPFMPVNRPLVEEYTGGWCGNCVMAAASMEKMRHTYGDDFVVVSIHTDDPAAIMSSYPSDISSGCPVAFLNRSRKTHPCFGDGSTANVHGVEQVWLEERAKFTPVAVEATASWLDDDCTQVKVEATVTAAKLLEGSFRLAYVLVADGLTGDTWTQSNYMSGVATADPWLLPYSQAPAYIKPAVWNDVAIFYPSTAGYFGSLPATLEPEQPNTHSMTLRTDRALSLSGESLAQDPTRMRVVALVINTASGTVLNSANAAIAGGAALPTVEAETAATVATEWYALDGRRLAAAPEKGRMAIRVDRLADGTSRTAKVAATSF